MPLNTPIETTSQAFNGTSATATLTLQSRVLVLSATTACYVNLQGGTASATAGIHLLAGTPLVIPVKTGSISVVKDTTDGTLNINVLG